MKPMTPALTAAPLSTAAAGIGAARYASGIHMWNGMRPIFAPKPRSSSVRVAVRQGDAGRAAAASLISRLWFGTACASITKAISRKASPSSASAT